MQKWGNEKKQMWHEYATRSYFKKKGGVGGTVTASTYLIASPRPQLNEHTHTLSGS